MSCARTVEADCRAVAKAVAAGTKALDQGDHRRAKEIYEFAHHALRDAIRRSTACVSAGRMASGAAFELIVPLADRFERFEKSIEG